MFAVGLSQIDIFQKIENLKIHAIFPELRKAQITEFTHNTQEQHLNDNM